MVQKDRRSIWGGTYVVSAVAVMVLAGTIGTNVSASAVGFVNWPAYLEGPTHTAHLASATAITPSDAATVTPAWTFMPGCSARRSPRRTAQRQSDRLRRGGLHRGQ